VAACREPARRGEGRPRARVRAAPRARQAVELRAKVQRELAAKEKEAKERELRELAMRARLDRAGGAAPPAAASRGAGVPAGAPRRPRPRAQRAERYACATASFPCGTCLSAILSPPDIAAGKLRALAGPGGITVCGAARSRRRARRGDAAGRPAAAAAGRPAAAAAGRPAAAAGGSRVARGARGARAARGDQVRPNPTLP